MGATLVVVLTTRYPVGEGEAAVNEPLTAATEGVSVSAAGWAAGVVQRAGGVQVKVKPDVGNTVEESAIDELFDPPAVVALQSVVDVRLL